MIIKSITLEFPGGFKITRLTRAEVLETLARDLEEGGQAYIEDKEVHVSVVVAENTLVDLNSSF